MIADQSLTATGETHSAIALLAAQTHFVGLHLRHLPGLVGNEAGMHLLALPACFDLPAAHGAFVEAESFDDGAHGTAERKQNQHTDNGLRIGFEPIEERAFSAGKRRLAGAASEAIFETVVDGEIALVLLAS